MIQEILRNQYQRTMREAYGFARAAAIQAPAGTVLDCGSGSGHELTATFGSRMRDPGFSYIGLEWSADEVNRGRIANLDIRHADLNAPLPVESGSIAGIIAYSVVEHLLLPCAFIRECHRVLRPGGRLVILTPNISTYFTALQVLFGKMPSSGPHPDSNYLINLEAPPKVSDIERDDMAASTPQHRHLVVFSFKALHKFLKFSGFLIADARGFGYYPLPRRLQPLFERLDKVHCHQMVFVCTRQAAVGSS